MKHKHDDESDIGLTYADKTLWLPIFLNYTLHLYYLLWNSNKTCADPACPGYILNRTFPPLVTLLRKDEFHIHDKHMSEPALVGSEDILNHIWSHCRHNVSIAQSVHILELTPYPGAGTQSRGQQFVLGYAASYGSL